MEQKNTAGSGFINGLMLGIVIGAGIAVLLTTKKGKRMLKAITEDGLDSINSLEDLYEKFEKIMKEDEAPASYAPVTNQKTLASTVIEESIAPVQAAPAPQVQPEQPSVEVKPATVASEVSVLAEALALAREPIPYSTPVAKAAEPQPAPTSVAQPIAAPPVSQSEVEYEESEPAKRKLVIAVDAQTSSKFAEVQQRLDQEIEEVSESIAQKFVAYSGDDMESIDEEEEEITPAKVKTTRRRFFRNIQRRA